MSLSTYAVLLISLLHLHFEKDTFYFRDIFDWGCFVILSKTNFPSVRSTEPCVSLSWCQDKMLQNWCSHSLIGTSGHSRCGFWPTQFSSACTTIQSIVLSIKITVMYLSSTVVNSLHTSSVCERWFISAHHHLAIPRKEFGPSFD